MAKYPIKSRIFTSFLGKSISSTLNSSVKTVGLMPISGTALVSNYGLVFKNEQTTQDFDNKVILTMDEAITCLMKAM